MTNWYIKFMAAALLLFGQHYLQAQTLPTGISGLRLWLDASDINNGTANPADGSSIVTWLDKSGLNNNATTFSGQASGKVYASQINGRAVVRFTRISQTSGSVYQVAGVDIRSTASNAVTLFTVYKQGTQSGDQALWGNDNGGWDRFFFSSWTSNGGANNGGVSIGNSAAAVSGAGVVGATRLLTAVYNRSAGTNGSAIYFNGQTVTAFTDATDPTLAYANLRIGFDGDDNCFNGDVAEMIVYNRQLTACEIQQVNRYLGSKYGITFSTVSITGTTSFPEGSSTTLAASTSGTAYQWLLNGVAITGAVSSSYTASAAGNYRVAVTNGCIDTSTAATVTATTMVAPGNALNLDGINDFIDCGNNASLAATNIKTMEAWVRFANFATDQEILSKSVSGSGIELLTYGGVLALYCMNAGSNISYVTYPVSNLSTGIWYHLAVAWDGTTKESMRLYVNGVPVGTRTDVGNINGLGVSNPSGSTFKIGQWSQPASNRFFNGSVDEVRVWSTQRSQSEIQAAMYNIIPASSPGLTAYYKFDLGTAGGTNTSTNLVYDVSGNGQVGTLNGFALSGAPSNWVESYAMVVPTPVTATSISSEGFTANWTAPGVGSVTNYLLDVSTNSTFSSFVTGYNGLNAGSGTSYAVTGLSSGTTYYYRTRASKSTVAGQGSQSATFTTTSTLALLPVTLRDFTVKQQANYVLLQWSTASEQNSDRFMVERSSNGTDFSAIGSIQAAGNSSSLLRYSTNDKTPGKGVNYYRLKQVDKDGRATFSAARQVQFVEGKNYVVVYPSLAIDHIIVESNNAGIAGKTGIISDIQGRVAKKFILTGNKQQVDISPLPKGIYHVVIADKNVFRIVKE